MPFRTYLVDFTHYLLEKRDRISKPNHPFYFEEKKEEIMTAEVKHLPATIQWRRAAEVPVRAIIFLRPATEVLMRANIKPEKAKNCVFSLNPNYYGY